MLVQELNVGEFAPTLNNDDSYSHLNRFLNEVVVCNISVAYILFITKFYKLLQPLDSPSGSVLLQTVSQTSKPTKERPSSSSSEISKQN